MVCTDSGGLFAVCDGHGGRACAAFVSSFLASKAPDIMEMASRPDAPTVLQTFLLDVDQAYMEQRNPFDESGCTCTLAVIKSHAEPLQSTLVLAHLGDSRALLGNSADGALVSGGGTEGALTVDHHPDLSEERERILRAGRSVQDVFGTARIDGSLALSRSFGDVAYKTAATPLDHAVTAVADVSVGVIHPSQFVVLCCDGVTEGTFSNEETASLVATSLALTGDPALAARDVCRAAIRAGSRDNVSCMVIVPAAMATRGAPTEELEEGPLRDMSDITYRDAYSAFSRRCGPDTTRSTWSLLH